MQTILITGHSGFIGSHLVKKLSKNYKIIGLGNEKLKQVKFLQIKQDIRKLNFKKLPNKISSIIHLAAVSDVEFCQKNPAKCFDINFHGTQNLLEVARTRNIKFLFLSTSHVFGNPQYLPINEKHRKNPESIYAASKLGGEMLCELYSKTYNMNISIARLFSIYGPRSPPHLVTTKIISQLLTKNQIHLGNMHTKRDFLYVDDAINGIITILKKIHGFNSYNIGSDKSYTISQICDNLTKIAGKKVKINEHKSSRKNDVLEIVSDSKKLKRLGWKPKTKLNQGLELTYNWFKANKK